MCNIVEENKIESPENLKANEMLDGSSAQSFHLLVPLRQDEFGYYSKYCWKGLYTKQPFNHSNNRVIYKLTEQGANCTTH